MATTDPTALAAELGKLVEEVAAARADRIFHGERSRAAG